MYFLVKDDKKLILLILLLHENTPYFLIFSFFETFRGACCSLPSLHGPAPAYLHFRLWDSYAHNPIWCGYGDGAKNSSNEERKAEKKCGHAVESNLEPLAC